ncbi:Gfo/Idh/MocA family protein [Actinophytocola sp. NPDC049390]|uniref:Gfo/Idh/MocA family protein n=1 Tax=Actinophytocola sp. NPDC049390 TaxID=3363894 RepID=UPI0037A98C5F
MTRPLRLGVVGLGVISRFYLSAIQGVPSVRLASVCDQSEARLSAYRGNVACYRTHRAMLAGTALDAVVVAVPNDAHFAVCHDALAAGLPVCVEKPLALTLEQGTRLVALAAERELPLFTAFHRRYNDNVRDLAHRLARRAPIESVRVRYLERIEDHAGDDAWYLDATRCGGGCVADNGPNAFDLVRLLAGPVRVTDAKITRDRAGVDRRAHVVLRSVDGATAHVELDWSYSGEVKDVEVRLTDGAVLRADMLAGHPRFKGSLWHEYHRIVDEFARVVARGEHDTSGGLAALSLVDETYRLAVAADA